MIPIDVNRLPYLSQKYNEHNLPLYLSYPVDSYWRDPADENIIAPALRHMEDAQVYVHIPFCKSICYYCCCDRVLSAKEEDKDTYIDYLDKELSYKLTGRSRKLKVHHMHWGGGTPAYMNMRQIERLYGVMQEHLDISETARIKMEAYPDKQIVTGEKLRLLRDLGFNYISFGIQDFDARVLKAIHRDCDLNDTREIIELAKSLGFIVNIDLCYGLPFQGLGEFERTLQEVMRIEPDKIVIYPYAHYPAIYPMQRKIHHLSLPNNYIKSLLFDLANQFLSVDYEKMGTDTFIRTSGREHKQRTGQNVVRDFMGSSELTSQQLLGLGKSAISKIGNTYYKNVSEMDRYYDYLDHGKLPLETQRTHSLSKEDLIREDVIQKNLLASFQIDKSAIGERFGVDFDTFFQDELAVLRTLEKDGLLHGVDTPCIAVTDTGSCFVRTIAHVFDSYYK
ncbi:oxygen-independent coproporphyrinogen III oxidase [Paenibacillus sp. BR2-3]|uniref:oxygen-independent coproporphyrinogen III oxidase n=1 Tax=Paenibacillus sp. BR2-3 TaxID=3048494 RepID=UPI003977D579